MRLSSFNPLAENGQNSSANKSETLLKKKYSIGGYGGVRLGEKARMLHF
jgi:hypothetical protein